MKTIGIAGTAKNTGKTTTLSALLDGISREYSLIVALTSIGYDGESFDNVTGLPKPRIQVRAGDIVALAERCVPFGLAKLEALRKTGIHTPLGEIIICRVTEPGKVVLAGPNNRRDLRAVLDMLAELGAELAIVDGALNRIAPMVEADGLLLATGAARHTDIDRLAGECADTLAILGAQVKQPRGSLVGLPSVLNDAGFDALLKALRDADTVTVRGIISEKYLARLANGEELPPDRLLLIEDSVKLLLSGETGGIRGILERMKNGPLELGVSKSLPPLAVTVNPYYPLYRFESREYEPGYVDAAELLEKVSAATGITCHDVVRQGGRELCGRVMQGVGIKPA